MAREETLSLRERKILEVLKSRTPLDLFTDKSVDPQRFVALAALTIEYAGNEQALRQVSKLLHLDEDRFDDAVEATMINRKIQNGFLLAYQGFAIGDPLLDTRLANWAEWEMATGKKPPLPPALLAKRQGHVALVEPSPEPEHVVQSIRQLWAEALVERYGGVPSEAQWQGDPIASRLPSPMAQSLHDAMVRRTSEVMQKRVKR